MGVSDFGAAITLLWSVQLVPPEGRASCYAQLYLYDPRQALQQRMACNEGLREDTMAFLQDTLSQTPSANLQ